MSDKFLPALDDLKAAILAGDDIETAIRETAEMHRLPPAALGNRARLAWGKDLDAYQRQAIEDAAKAKDDVEFQRAVTLIRANWRDDITEADKAWLYSLPKDRCMRADAIARRKTQGLDENGQDPTIGWMKNDGAIGFEITCPQCGKTYQRLLKGTQHHLTTRLRDVGTREARWCCGAFTTSADIAPLYPSGHPKAPGTTP